MIRIAAALLLLTATAAHSAPSDGACVDKGPVAIDFGTWALVVDDEDGCPSDAASKSSAPKIETTRCVAYAPGHMTFFMRKVDGQWIERKEPTCLKYED